MAEMLSVVILTYNEAMHIERALRSLAGLGADVFVVDSFSNDETVELAQAWGARVVQHAFVNQAQQFQWALDTLPLTREWVMRLDADEEVSEELRLEIVRRLPVLPKDVAGIYLKRRHIFMGRWIRYGGRYPLKLLRIWRRGAARVEQRWMDEHMVLSHGRTETFQYDFVDNNVRSLTFFTDKHNAYATREAVEILRLRYACRTRDLGILASGSFDQAYRKRFVKEQIYNRLPMWAGPLSYFFLRYFLQLGFLDGRPGLVYHLLQGFWYRFLIEAKVAEFEAAMRPLDTSDEALRKLESLSGLPLRSPTSSSDDSAPPLGAPSPRST